MSAPSQPASSAAFAPPGGGTVREYAVGEHIGFPTSKVCLWIATAPLLRNAAVRPLNDLPQLLLPEYDNPCTHLEATGSFYRLSAGTVLASCLPQDEDNPLRHQLIFYLSTSPYPEPLKLGDSALASAARMDQWMDWQVAVVGQPVTANTTSQNKLSEAHPLMKLPFMPGIKKGPSATSGSFITGVVESKGFIVLAANSTDYGEASATRQLSCERRQLLAAMTQVFAKATHEVIESVHAPDHCAMLAGRLRASSIPRLTLGGSESWSANHLQFDVRAASDNNPGEPVAWTRVSSDDAFLPSSSVYLPSVQDSEDTHPAVWISSLGFFVELPAGPVFFLAQRCFASYLHGATPKSNAGSSAPRQPVVQVTAVASAAVMRESCLTSNSMHNFCSVEQGLLSAGLSFLTFARDLKGALGSSLKASAWLDRHMILVLSASRDTSAQAPETRFLSELWQLWSTVYGAETTTDVEAAQLCKQLSFAPSGYANEVAPVEMVLDAFNLLASANTGRAAYTSAAWTEELEEYSESSGVQIWQDTGSAEGAGDPEAGAAATKARSRRGRAAKRQKLSRTPNEMLMLRKGVASDCDPASLPIADGQPGPDLLSSIVEYRIAALEEETLQGRASLLHDPLTLLNSQGLATCDALARADGRLAQLFSLNEPNEHAGLRYLINGLTQAHTFYTELQSFAKTLSRLAVTSRDDLAQLSGVDDAVARLVILVRERVNGTPSPPADSQASPDLPASLSPLTPSGCALDSTIAQDLAANTGGTCEADADAPAGVAPIMLRLVPIEGSKGPRSAESRIAAILLDVLLQTKGRRFALLMGSEEAELNVKIFDFQQWPRAAKVIKLRLHIVETLWRAHGFSYRALALPGVCTFVLMPFWFLTPHYSHGFWSKNKSAALHPEWAKFLEQVVSWTKKTKDLRKLYDLTMGSPPEEPEPQSERQSAPRPAGDRASQVASSPRLRPRSKAAPGQQATPRSTAESVSKTAPRPSAETRRRAASVASITSFDTAADKSKRSWNSRSNDNDDDDDNDASASRRESDRDGRKEVAQWSQGEDDWIYGDDSDHGFDAQEATSQTAHREAPDSDYEDWHGPMIILKLPRRSSAARAECTVSEKSGKSAAQDVPRQRITAPTSADGVYLEVKPSTSRLSSPIQSRLPSRAAGPARVSGPSVCQQHQEQKPDQSALTDDKHLSPLSVEVKHVPVEPEVKMEQGSAFLLCSFAASSEEPVALGKRRQRDNFSPVKREFSISGAEG